MPKAFAALAETRVMTCQECGGDGGWDVPYDVDRVDGSICTRFQKCELCNGTGDEEVEVEPLEIEDLT